MEYKKNPFDLNIKNIFLLLVQKVMILETSTEEVLFYHQNLSLQSVMFIESV